MKKLGLLTVVVILLTVLVAGGYAQSPGYVPGMMSSGSSSFRGYEDHEMDHNLIVPQIAIGQSYTTNFVLLNLGNRELMGWVSAENLKATGKVYFYRQDGSRLPVSVNGSAPLTELSFSLEPSATASFALTSAGSDTSGWALIEVEDQDDSIRWGMRDGEEMKRGERVMATVFYTYRGSQAVSRVGVIPATYERGRFFNSVTAVQNQLGLYTGIAVVNTGAQAASIHLRLRDAGGLVVASQQFFLQAGNQIARFVHELFNTIPPGFQGFMEVSTNDEGVVTMGLLESQGVLTSVPTLHYGRITSMMP